MVFFICNHCGESLKKQVVSAHAYRCNRQINVSCMDCLKDFPGQSYDAHTVCISEAEKYAAKGFVAKEKKGAKKQESWVTMVRAISQRNNNLSAGVKSVFEIISRIDNVPRKYKPFVNYFQNSFRYLCRKDVEQAWTIIQREVKSENPTPAQQNGAAPEPGVPTKNGTADSGKNGEAAQSAVTENEPSHTKQKKRKTEDTSENGHDQVESQSTKQKKRKTKDAPVNGQQDESALLENEINGSEEQTGDQEKFHWSEVIRDLLVSKNNQMKLSKLKKKVMKRYQQTTGDSETDDGKFEKKFQKKLAKNSGIVVENGIVRLVEA